MPWLVLALWLELGFTPMDRLAMYDFSGSAYTESTRQFYSQMHADIIGWDHLFAGGDIRIYAWLDETRPLAFIPNRGAFEMHVGLRFDPIEIGFRHYCTHPITPHLPIERMNIRWEGGYEEVYIRMGRQF